MIGSFHMRLKINFLVIKKINYFQLKLQNFSGDSKNIWSNLNSMFRNKNESHEICLRGCNDTCITDCKQVSNIPNKNFPNVVHELYEQIPTTNESPKDYIMSE